jgi:CMP-N,N'-diacetyllegionaminic acid synthase
VAGRSDCPARVCFDRVIVSSDAPDILAAVQTAPNVITDLRPSQLATDYSKVIETVIFYFHRLKAQAYDQIWLCLPTCPLRMEEDLRAGIELLTPDLDGVVSVTEYEFPPTFALRIENGLLGSLFGSHLLAAGNSRSQDQPSAYRPNGAFYGMWWASFCRYQNFYRGNVKAALMPRERSIDVDDELDLRLAEMMLG